VRLATARSGRYRGQLADRFRRPRPQARGAQHQGGHGDRGQHEAEGDPERQVMAVVATLR
jgi:hypothetical protein